MRRDPHQRERARELRREMTPAEAILWKLLRGRRFAGLKFRRQHPLGPFYADFACVERSVVVEVDGETHLGREANDEARSAYLRDEGWMVLRYWNTEVYDERDAVEQAIFEECAARPPHPQPLSPKGARGERSADARLHPT